MSLQARIKNIVEHISTGMHEREDIISISLLGALSNQNTFLFGSPGTAKSLISRRIACAFKEPAYFEYLMNRFSTPEELFGPVSIKALKEDKYTRKTSNYLPKAEFAFLDEIWKSSPAILNSLLTMINEKTFKNGDVIENTPLKALIVASNETPEGNQGLDALYDRFIIRLMVAPIARKDNFENLINGKPTQANIKLPSKIAVSQNEWNSWRKKIDTVCLSKETLLIIHAIRKSLSEQFEELGVYVSDRRWQKAAQLLKASAFFNDRKETNHSDALLLSHCIWTTADNHEPVIKIVHDAIKAVGFTSDISLEELDKEKESLDKEIHKELFFRNDVYKTEKIGNKKYFKAILEFKHKHHRTINTEKEIVFLPYSNLKTTDTFFPLDNNLNELSHFDCTFNGQGSCKIENLKTYNYAYEDTVTFTPTILFHKGDKKDDINTRLIDSLNGSVIEIRKKLMVLLKNCQDKNNEYKAQLASPFINEELLKIPLVAIENQLKNIELSIKDCQRLEVLCSV
ncbi:AAA family ATPase [Algibacillus agarilyticus]|uniref:AAA family ATPase n=1 Tax=Algibacillus agarilyticus TaxID=2234133 RepID=UPI000DD0BAD1|nr:AAA family ATPase [Algibacillus agarilyticus]